MHQSTRTLYQRICQFRRLGRSAFINKLSVLIAVGVCLTAAGAVAESVGPFPGSAVNSRTMRIQEMVEELFEQRDYERAHFIYRNELAPIGDKYAQYMVGYMYWTGTGVAEDSILASAWYRLAAERSYKEFQNERDLILAGFTAAELLHSDNQYLQLRRQYCDVVLLLQLIEADIDMSRARTGSRLSGSGGSVTIIDPRTGASVSGDQYFGQIRRRVTARLKFMAKQLNMPDLNTNPDKVDIDELWRIVNEFVETIADR